MCYIELDSYSNKFEQIRMARAANTAQKLFRAARCADAQFID